MVRFRRRPGFARLRALGPGQRLAGAFTELNVRLDGLTAAPPNCTSIYVIENDITYLAFPAVADAVAIFGGGADLTDPIRHMWR